MGRGWGRREEEGKGKEGGGYLFASTLMMGGTNIEITWLSISSDKIACTSRPFYRLSKPHHVERAYSLS